MLSSHGRIAASGERYKGSPRSSNRMTVDLAPLRTLSSPHTVLPLIGAVQRSEVVNIRAASVGLAGEGRPRRRPSAEHQSGAAAECLRGAGSHIINL